MSKNTKQVRVGETPPPSQRMGNRVLGALRTAVEANPGEWCSQPGSSGSAGYYRDLGYEVVLRTVDGQLRIYARTKPEVQDRTEVSFD